MFNPAHFKNHTNNPLEIYTLQFCFSNRLLCICCVDIMSIFVSYIKRVVDVLRAYWFVFVALRPMSTAMVIAGRSVHLTTLFPGQA